MVNESSPRPVFFPKSDASILSYTIDSPQTWPTTVSPIRDPDNYETAALPWSSTSHNVAYPPSEPYAPAKIPAMDDRSSDRYLRASLARNERLRLSMLWYYTRDVRQNAEFMSGVQEKVCIAQETTEWELAIVGVLDVNIYTRLATVGVPLAILPRGEATCAHTILQPPGSVFLLPDMQNDWRFATSPHVEFDGLRAYAGVPLRLRYTSGETIALGSLCVASASRQEPLTRAQQLTLTRVADCVVADMVQITKLRRQRDRQRMADLLVTAQKGVDNVKSEEPVLHALRAIYPDATVSLQVLTSGTITIEGHPQLAFSDFFEGLWEDSEYIDQFIAKSNHLNPPTDKLVRVIAAQCDNIAGQSLLLVKSKDFTLVFDDIDTWFIRACAEMITQTWHKKVLAEVMLVKEKFLRGFSHQLRTPIHGILGSVELLAEEWNARDLNDTTSLSSLNVPSRRSSATTQSGEEHSVYLNTIKHAGQDLRTIINSMITLNKWTDVAIGDRQYTVYTVNELEDELADATTKAMSEGARYSTAVIFTHDLFSEGCTLRVDIGLLRESLLPLIINAIKNTARGIVTITISFRTESKKLVVDIEDTGCGIAAEDQQRIFELYEKGNSFSSGAGLGLTLATQFAALLHGSIELVSSGLGQGSHFRATFEGSDISPSETTSAATMVSARQPIQPRHFHVISSSTLNSILLRKGFSLALTSYGISASDDINSHLVIVDLVTDPDEQSTILSRLSPAQVAIYLAPWSEDDGPFGSSHDNSILIRSISTTSTIKEVLADVASITSASSNNAHKGAQSSNSLIPLLRSERLSDSEQIESETSHDGTIKIENESGIDAMLSQKLVFQDHHVSTSSADVDDQQTLQSDAVNGVQCLLDANMPSPDLLSLRVVRTAPEYDKQATIDLDGDVNGNSMRSQIALTSNHTSSSSTSRFSRTTTAFPLTMIVDDNDINLRILQMYCHRRQLPYVCAKDGLEAIELFRKHQETWNHSAQYSPIQLILMDLQMPRCDGIEATRQIRLLEESQKWDNSLIFMVTGQDSAADRQAAQDVRSQEYLVKPVSVKSLDKVIQQYFPRFGEKKVTV